MEAKNKGLCVICITNLAHSGSVASRHPSGKKPYQLCDIVIDNCGVVEKLQEEGVIPEVFISGNVDGGHEKNRVYYQKYRQIIRML